MKKLLVLLSLIFFGCTNDDVQPKDPIQPEEKTKETKIVVHFDFDSSELGEEQKKILKEVVADQYKKETSVLIVAHTDSQGAEEYNQKLSAKRAGAVSEYLNSLNVPNSWEAKGESLLLNEDKTIAEHKVNRRAEVNFVIVIEP